MNKPYIVDNSYEGIRIDKWIRNNLGNVPQGLIEKSLRAGKIKLEITDTIQDLESKIEAKKEETESVSTPQETLNIDTTTIKIATEKPESPVVKANNISFNDTDSVVKYDTKDKPSNTPEPEKVTAPKTIERLEEISHVRNEQRKLDEAEEDDDDEEDKLTIFNEAPSLKLDALDVQILDDSLALKKPPVLTGVETLI